MDKIVRERGRECESEGGWSAPSSNPQPGGKGFVSRCPFLSHRVLVISRGACIKQAISQLPSRAIICRFDCNKLALRHEFFSFPQVKYISYSDEIASLIDAKPNLWQLLRKDPVLACRCFFGPCVPAQYRLKGQGAWQGARDVIMGVQESRLFPLRTRKTGFKEEGSKVGLLLWLLALLVSVIAFTLVHSNF